MKQNNFVPITCLANGSDAKMFTAIVNQGIDAHLEAFTQSKFSYKGPRLVLDFHVSELPILVRRLQEMAYDETGELVNESAQSWADDIESLDEYKAVSK